MIAERSRLNTQRFLAVRLPEPSLSNVWWPLRLKSENTAAEKVIALWFNSTLGLLVSIAHRIPTEGAWIQFKKPTIENLPILDVTSMPNDQIRRLAAFYDSIAGTEFDTIMNMANDPVRADIDHAFSQILNLPSSNSLRAELANEPIRLCRQHNSSLNSSKPIDGKRTTSSALIWLRFLAHQAKSKLKNYIEVTCQVALEHGAD